MLRYDIGDVIPWMTVKALLESLLIHIMSNKTYAATQHKQRVNGADINVLLSLLTAITIQE